MTCKWHSLPDGTMAIVCGSRRSQRCACGRIATLLCDWKVPGLRTTGTCDSPLCPRCAFKPDAARWPDKDLCRHHFTAWQRRSSGQELSER